MMNLKHLMFGEAIALYKASADFPLPNPKKGASKTDFEAPFSSSLLSCKRSSSRLTFSQFVESISWPLEIQETEFKQR
jgi:hypothetical protein